MRFFFGKEGWVSIPAAAFNSFRVTKRKRTRGAFNFCWRWSLLWAWAFVFECTTIDYTLYYSYSLLFQ